MTLIWQKISPRMYLKNEKMKMKNEKVNKTYSMLGIIERNFTNLNKHFFVLLYKVIVRAYLEYANSVWSPYKKILKILTKYKKIAAKLIIFLKHLPYTERLKQLMLFTLKYRRLNWNWKSTNLYVKV